MVKRSIGLLAAALAFSAAPPSSAAITGLVIDAATSQPLAGARVRVQTTTVVPAISDGSGRFVLASVPPGLVVVTAVLPYAAAREVNYITGSTSAQDGEDVLIVLERLPAEDVSSPYDPGTSFTCGTCHADQHAEWLSSNHANAGRNEWVLDLFSGTGTPGGSAGYVFRDTHEADDSGFCATCHAPLEDALAIKALVARRHMRGLPADRAVWLAMVTLFFVDLFETALADDEVVTAVSFPVPKRAAYAKFPNPASRYAIVGVFVAKSGDDVRVAVTGAKGSVFRVAEMEQALAKRFDADAIAGVEVPADDMNADIHASAEYRAHLVTVMAKRAVARANG